MVRSPAETSDNQRIIPTLALFKHVQENRRFFEAMSGGRGLDMLLEKGQVYWSKRAEAQLRSFLPPGQTPAVPLSLMAGYLSGTLSVFLKWWVDDRLSHSPEQLDEMFQQMAMSGVWAALGKD